VPAPRLNDPENGTSQQPISSDQDGALIGELRQLGRIEDADRVQRCGLIPTPNGLVRCRLARRGCRSCAESEVRKSSVMTNRWRLINGEKLYDIEADPKQQNDVAADHPGSIERLA